MATNPRIHCRFAGERLDGLGCCVQLLWRARFPLGVRGNQSSDESSIESTRREIASAVAHGLEQTGYTVVNQPDAHADQMKSAKQRIKDNVHDQDWK